MKRLWAPWRIEYIQKKSKGCIFCKTSKSKQDRKNFIVHRSKYCFAILNIYPYTNGHIMVAPYRHVRDIDKLKENELLDLLNVMKLVKKKLDKFLKPTGYNMGMNVGRVGGAGFDKHLHIHIVPRWRGDINFMPIIAETKVISQSLREVYSKLKKV